MYLSLGRDFALSLILGLQNVRAVLCHLFRCFDPRFKENIHCHPAFIIRDINSCRKGYSKDRLKSRESDLFNIQIAFKFHHKTLRHSAVRVVVVVVVVVVVAAVVAIVAVGAVVPVVAVVTVVAVVRVVAVVAVVSVVNVNVICLSTKHQGVHKNSLRNVGAFQDRIGI